MSLLATMRLAATSAQSTLSQMQGATPTAAGVLTNALLSNGNKVLGVYGFPRVTFVPVGAGGYRKKTELAFTVTRYSLTPDKVPKFNTSLVRTDLDPQFTYTIESIGTQDALVWVFNLVNFADRPTPSR